MRAETVGAALAIGLAAVVAISFVPVGTEGEPAPTYEVVGGDSLSRIAQAHGVTTDQLRDWNGIDGDLIHAGQTLAVGTAIEGERQRMWQVALSKLTSGPQEEVEPVTEAEVSAQAGPRSRGRSARRSNPGVSPGAEEGDPAPREWAALSMPAAKPCLDPEAGIDGGSFGRSQGLESEQIAAVVEAFQEQTLRCYDGRPDADGEVMLTIVSGCDGRVRSASVSSDGTGEPGFAACVADVFRHAAFPPHARDTVEFMVPLRYVPAPSEDSGL